MKKFVIALLFSLTACGSGNSTTPVVSTGTGLPYYPMTAGTYQTFTIGAINAAHWAANTKELIIDAVVSGTVQGHKYLVEQYSQTTCPASFGDKPFYVNAYSFNDTGLSQATPDLSNALEDGFFTSSTGVAFLGEALNPSVHGDIGEPIISSNPVAGEHIHTHEVLMGLCGNNVPTGQTLDTDYYTVRHVDDWNGFKDAWITTLIERPDTDPTYYEFIYAASTPSQFGGLVGEWCWNAKQDHYSCGNLYTAIPKTN